jgi:DNA-binding Lrp family transcriptional regulator
MKYARLPRFTRSAEIKPIRLTDRDLEILRLVHRHRFLRSSHIVRLVQGSPQQILRRLKLLFHHGCLERPRAQIDYFNRAGSQPIIYGLGNKGAGMLRLELPVNLNWKNQSVGRLFLDHAVLTADVMVAFELACRSRADVRLLDGEQVPLPANVREQDGLFQWHVTLERRQKLSVVPDRVFAFEFTQPDKSPALLFLEADRATMPVTRQNLSRSSFQRKLLAYHATWKQGLHKSHFGFPRFRVVTVTTSAERMQSMIDACSELEGGHGLFLFAEASALLGSNPLTYLWKNGSNELTLLTD